MGRQDSTERTEIHVPEQQYNPPRKKSVTGHFVPSIESFAEGFADADRDATFSATTAIEQLCLARPTRKSVARNVILPPT